MEQQKEYYAFISYKSEDVEWAIWLQHELEHYHLPASYNGRTDIRQELRPVFRDMDELSAGNLPGQIKQALGNSQNLIVVCSPQAAASPWVNQEVETFISLGRTDRIFPFIVEGNSPRDFFPPALLALPKKEERLGGNAAKQGRDIAFVKVVAGMLGLGFDSLWNRYEKEKAEEERKEREKKEKLQIVQSRFVSEKAMQLLDDYDISLAKKLLLEVLPEKLKSPSRPYTEEAEFALRKAISTIPDHHVLQNHKGSVLCVAFNPSGNLLASSSADSTIRIWNTRNWKCQRVLHGHSGRVNSVSFSSNGDKIVSASDDKSVRVWDVKSGLCKLTCNGHARAVYSACFSIDGESVYSASGDNTIIVWNATNGKRVQEFLGHTGFVNSIMLSPNGLLVLSASSDKTARLWDSKTGDCLCVFEGHQGAVNSASFDKNGTLIVTASDDHTVMLWNINGKMIKKYEGHKKGVLSARFSNNNNYIISSSSDKTIRVWDKDTGFCVRVLTRHVDYVNCIANSPKSSVFVSASKDNTIQTWEYDKKEYSFSFVGYGKYFLRNNIVFYEDLKCDYLKVGAIDLSIGKEILNMSVESMPVIHRLSNIFLSDGILNEHASSVYVSPDGWRHNPYIFLSPNAKYMGIDLLDSIRFIDMLSGKVIEIKVNGDIEDTLSHLRYLNSFCFLNDEYVVIKTNYTDTTKATEEVERNTIQIHLTNVSICKINSGMKVFSFEGSFFDEEKITISPSEDRLVVCSSVNISLWDLHSGNCIKEVVIPSLLNGQEKKTTPLKVLYSPDGKHVAIGYSVDLDIIDGWKEYHSQVYLLDNELNLIKSFTGATFSCFSPVSNQMLIRNVVDRSYQVWDIVVDNIISAKYLFGIEGNLSVFSKSGKVLVTTTDDFKLMICNLLSLSGFRIPDGHTDSIVSVDISPNEKYIATASFDMTIKIWSVATGRCVQVFTGHTGRILKVSFSTDGRRLFSTSDDNTIKVWDFPPLQELIDETRKQFKGNPLTFEERTQYYLE